VPVGFWSLLHEPLVLTKLFDWVFEKIDTESFRELGLVPSQVFSRYFLSLFSDVRNSALTMTLMDLILTQGSGVYTATLKSNEPRYTNRILSRTEQLLLSTGLSMLRQVIYDM